MAWEYGYPGSEGTMIIIQKREVLIGMDIHQWQRAPLKKKWFLDSVRRESATSKPFVDTVERDMG